MARIAINGFGRIGRSALKAAWFAHPSFEVVAINDLADAQTLAYLLQSDSNYGRWSVPVKSVGKHTLVVGGRKISVSAQKDPAQLPWRKHGVDVVVEASGLFTTKAQANAHLQAGARRVVLSAPGKDDIPIYVRGVNDQDLRTDDHPIISNASCTTTCVAPITAILEAVFGIKKAMLTTVHSYTASQMLVDGPKKDLREGRAAALNIIPTSTGAALAVTQALPKLAGRFDGLSIRVPTATVSLADMTFLLKRKVTKAAVNAALMKASKATRWRGLVGVSFEPLVSCDYRGDPRSAIVDAELTQVVDGDLVKVVAWYDNEWGYANRLVEITLMAAK